MHTNWYSRGNIPCSTNWLTDRLTINFTFRAAMRRKKKIFELIKYSINSIPNKNKIISIITHLMFVRTYVNICILRLYIQMCLKRQSIWLAFAALSSQPTRSASTRQDTLLMYTIVNMFPVHVNVAVVSELHSNWNLSEAMYN